MAGATWLQLALSLVSFAVITTRLTPAEVGLFGAGILVAGFISNLFGGPFSDSLQQRSELSRDHVDSSFWIGVSLSLVVAAAIALTAGWLAQLFGAPGGGRVMAVLCLLMPLNAAAAAPNALLSRDLKFDAVARAGALSSILASLAGIAAIFSGLGVWSLVIAELTRQAARLTTLLVLSGYAPAWPQRFSAFGDLARFNLGTLGVFLIGQADRVAPRAIVGAMLGVTALGYFVIAERLLELLNQLALGPLGAVTMTSTARLQRDAPALQAFIRGLYRAAPLLGYPVFLGAAAVVPPLVDLAGPQWQQATLAAQLLLLVGLRTTTGTFNLSILRGLGSNAAPLLLLGSGLVLQVLLVPLGAHYLGVAGAALGVLARTYATWPLGCWLVTKATGVPVKDQLLGGGAAFVAAAAMALATTGLIYLLRDQHALARLLAGVAGGIGVYAGVLLLISPRLRRLSSRATEAFFKGGVRSALRAVSAELGFAP